MKSSESIFCKKWAFFRFLAEKIFSVAAREVARRWSARTACEAFRAASVCVWMDVPGRVWMDAMEVAHV